MAQAIELYEQKNMLDADFPIQLGMNRVFVKGTYFDAHWHEHYELCYVVSGRTTIRLDQQELTAQKGDLVIANSNVLHEGISDGNGMATVTVIFAMEDFSTELAEKNIIFSPLIRQDAQIGRIMMQICEEYQEQKIGYRLSCKGALFLLVTYLVRNYTQEMLSDSDSVKRRKKLERLNTVNQYIAGHYTESISNRQLAELIHVSEDRFNHLFKEGMGMSPLQYINELRLQKAMRLLKKGELTATEAASIAGFTDYNHFGRMFRRYYGCTPMEVKGNSRIV